MRSVFALFSSLLSLALTATAWAENGSYKDLVIDTHSGPRRAILYSPAGITGIRHAPLLIALHGGGGNPEGFIVSSGLSETADQYNFMLVYPQGSELPLLGHSGYSWNAGECCTAAGSTPADDVGFISELITYLIKEYKIDPRRVYATGLSNGSQMTFRLACELSDQIAAIAGVASQDVLDLEACKRTLQHPMPLIYFHGLVDPCAHYEGGNENGGCFVEFLVALGALPPGSQGKLWSTPSVPDMIQDWVKINGCHADEELVYEKNGATCIQYDHCRKNAEVTLCTDPQQGHGWPGGTHGKICQNPSGYLCQLYTDIMGEISQSLPASDLIWTTLRNHKLPRRLIRKHHRSKAGDSLLFS